MGKSRAEIQRSYRQRKKLKEGKKYLEKESERVKKYYKPTTELTPQALKKRRARIRKCMERSRKEMKEKEKSNHDSMELEIENSVLPQINLEDESGPCDSTTPSTSRGNCPLLRVRMNFKKKQSSGGKALKTAKAKIKRLETKVKTMTKYNDRLRKRLVRAKLKTDSKKSDKNNSNIPLTPRSLSKKELRNEGLSPSKYPKIVKQLTFHHSLVNNISEKLEPVRGKSAQRSVFKLYVVRLLRGTGCSLC